ncbi:hypothetical protein AB0M47_39205 [Hamadaea sp. NPDC051192]|uniref:hypothetical protein n=1 Tax=Hamadaea sp. NPDC051192 TaxID=3154940 RepID=UPI0034163FE9
MDTAAPVFHRFPLVARPRPVCGPLADRIGDLSKRAGVADRDPDPALAVAQAASVHNLAALIVSDVGHQDQARELCYRHALAYATARPSASNARYSLEPLINLARLMIREGHGNPAFELLDDLYKAVSTRTDTVVDGVCVPGSTLTSTPDDHAEVVKWLWGVHLAEGSRALVAAGRWPEAVRHLKLHKGIGNRMTDGRQVAVIAAARRHDKAMVDKLLDNTSPGEPWESAVAACLWVLCTTEPATDHVHAMINTYRDLDFVPATAVFGTRLGLCVVAAATPTSIGGAERVAAAVLDHTAAARVAIADAMCMALAQPHHRATLDVVLNTSGLGKRDIPGDLQAEMGVALDRASAVIARVLQLPANSR